MAAELREHPVQANLPVQAAPEAVAKGQGRRRTLLGYVLLGTAFLACPCHLVLTAPLAIALLGGTALGVFLAQNLWLLVAVATVYFFVALLVGYRLVSGQQACPTPSTPNSQTDSIRRHQ